MSDEIFEGIKKHLLSESYSMHTPGHKGLLSRFDITEIDDSFPASSIEAAQKRVAEIYKVMAVRFLTNGSSIGIKAGLMSLPGDVLVESNAHQAVFEGLELCGKRAVIIKNRIKDGLSQPLSAQQIDEALSQNPDIKTVVVTSPDYYGFICDAGEVIKAVKRHGAYLYADSAHGAHFRFREDLFGQGFIGQADIVNISAHKTMPAFTQSAYLCINNETLIEKIDYNLRLLGTTSPSYLLLGGLEYAAKYCNDNSQKYDMLFTECSKLRNSVKCVENDDFSRIVIDAGYYKLSGENLYYKLKENGIVCEKYDKRYVVLIVSIADDLQGIKKLREKLIAMLGNGA